MRAMGCTASKYRAISLSAAGLEGRKSSNLSLLGSGAKRKLDAGGIYSGPGAMMSALRGDTARLEKPLSEDGGAGTSLSISLSYSRMEVSSWTFSGT